MAFEGRIGHLEDVGQPWGNAGGVVKTVGDVEAMAQTGVGWIEAGSYTLEPREGNHIHRDPEGSIIKSDGKVWYYDSENGEMYNSLGMPNKGMDTVEKEIPEMVRLTHAYKKKLVVNVAPVTSDPVGELEELVSRAYEAKADAVLVNAGCSNVLTEDGSRHEILSYKPDALRMVLAGLKQVTQKYKPVFVRLSPYANGHMRLHTSQILWTPTATKGVVSALFTPNTWPGCKPLNENNEPILEVPGGTGGKSGPAMADAAARETQLFAEYLSDTNIDVVSSSGIMNANELKRRLDLGAVAGAGTSFYYTSEEWKRDTDKLLSEFAQLYDENK